MEHECLVLKTSELLELQYVGSFHTYSKFDVSHMHSTYCTHTDQFSGMSTVTLTHRGYILDLQHEPFK